MRCNIPSVNCALRIARALNDPYGSNELNLPLADRYNAGVLDMTGRRGCRETIFGRKCKHFSRKRNSSSLHALNGKQRKREVNTCAREKVRKRRQRLTEQVLVDP